MKTFKVLLVLMLLSVGTTAGAETILRTGESVSITEGQAVVGDFYSLASILNISGRVEGDVIAAAGRFTSNGEVAEDVLAIGGSIDVHGPVGDDMRVIGGEVVIAEPVVGSVFVLGGRVSILSTASVGGDVLIYGGEVEILGAVAGDVLGGYNTLRIDAPVGGDVTVQVEQLTLGDNAAISGTLSYSSAQLVERAPNAIVTGEIIRQDRPSEYSLQQAVQGYVVLVLIVAFSSLTWFLLSRRTLQVVVDRAFTHTPVASLYGLAALILTPIVVAVLLTSMLGSLVGGFLLAAYVVLAVTAVAAMPVLIGTFALRVAKLPETSISLSTILSGLLILGVVQVVPIAGLLILLAVWIIAFGTLVDSIIRLVK